MVIQYMWGYFVALSVIGDHSNAVQPASTIVTLERKANLKERNPIYNEQ